MSKRNIRRSVNKKQGICYAESSESDDSYDDMEWLGHLALALQSSLHKKNRSGRKTNIPKKIRTPRRNSHITNVRKVRNLSVPLSSSRNNENSTKSMNLEESVIAEQSKKVEDKVESFFKAHNLISDDEDEHDKTSYPPKDAKEFYELSDSDDDIKLDNFISHPSTSHINADNVPSTSSTRMNMVHSVSVSNSHNFNDTPDYKSDELIDLVEIPTPSKDDELMDIVDKILENSDKPIDIISEKDNSWTDYKNKAEEILGNISNLLDGISKDAKPKTVESEPAKQESPKSTKPTCPICFETLGGDILAVTTVCGHIFCKMCIEQVAKTVKKCPTCRKVVNQKKIHPVYL